MSALKIPHLPEPTEELRRAICLGLQGARVSTMTLGHWNAAVEEISARVAAISRAPLRWTAERPLIPGYYWVAAPGLSRRVANFYLHGSILMSDYGDIGANYGRPALYSDRPVEEPR